MRFSCAKLACVFPLAFAACASENEPSAPLLPTTAALNNGNGVVLHVNGAGAVDLSAAAAGEAPFQFVAHKKADGSVSGHFRQSRSTAAGTVDFAGIVTCLTIDPNFPGRARIGGRVTENNSTNPAFRTENHEVGDDVWFRVQDGGNGGDADDRSTTYGFKPTLVDTSEQYCALPFDGLPWWNPASIFPLAHGTIRVKD
jgi:hypothetical protein